MWHRKELKARGRLAFRRNLWAAIAVCFILAFTGAEFADSVGFIRDFDPARAQTEVEVVQPQQAVSNWDTMLKWLNVDTLDGTHPMWAAADASVKPYFDALTVSASALFAFLDRSSFTGWTGVTLAMLGMAGGVFFSIWIIPALIVGARRFFLENRAADHISIAAMFTPLHRGNWWNTVKAMLLKSVFLFLWALTLAGFFIKMYSYRMVPYILAENPQANAREAITLSRRMMKGSKWHCFVIDLSFFMQWTVLPAFFIHMTCLAIGLLTGQAALLEAIAVVALGLLALVYVNGYRSATFAELYIDLRRAQLEKDEPLARLFTEPALDPEPAPAAQPAPSFHIKHHHKFDYNRHYSIRTLILLFFSFAFVGWVWEVALHIVTQSMFINRGTMFGPWLPIYGAGGALVLLLLKKLFKSPVATFFVSMVLCSVIEYFTSWYLEFTKGVRWWDYSGYFMNLNGRICLEGAVVFGLGCCAVVYFAGPALGALIDRLSPAQQTALCTVLIALFSADAVYSHFHPNAGKGITDYDDWQGKDAPAAEGWLTARACAIRAARLGTGRFL